MFINIVFFVFQRLLKKEKKLKKLPTIVRQDLSLDISDQIYREKIGRESTDVQRKREKNREEIEIY